MGRIYIAEILTHSGYTMVTCSASKRRAKGAAMVVLDYQYPDETWEYDGTNIFPEQSEDADRSPAIVPYARIRRLLVDDVAETTMLTLRVMLMLDDEAVVNLAPLNFHRPGDPIH